MIEIRDVGLSIGGARILQDVNLTVPGGGITALIGPNGAGKSTLLSLIARLMPCDTGAICVGGDDVHRLPTAEVARRIAIMPQQSVIASRLRVRELVSFGRFPHHRGRLTGPDLEAVDDAIDLFELRPLAERFLDTLSGGQRQRARAAMAYCQGTDHLLLDEPLNNLDIYYARQLMQMLRKGAADSNKTIVIVLHDLNYAAVYADYIVAMRDGRVVAAGARDEVMRAPTLELVFGYDIAVEKIQDIPVSLHFL